MKGSLSSPLLNPSLKNKKMKIQQLLKLNPKTEEGKHIEITRNFKGIMRRIYPMINPKRILEELKKHSHDGNSWITQDRARLELKSNDEKKKKKKVRVLVRTQRLNRKQSKLFIITPIW